MNEQTVKELIAIHQSNGRFEEIDGIKIFGLDEGSGEAIFCIHGVPTSSFLYRKVTKLAAEKGFRGIAIDLPGLGLSDRPGRFNYCFSNFAQICRKFLERLDVHQFHLVIHDIGAPIGLTLAAKHKEKVKSITVLNSMLDIKNFEKPLPMRPFEVPLLGELELAMMNYFTWRIVINLFGLNSSKAIPGSEKDVYVNLLKREDNGRAFLKIMRNFEQTEELNQLCFSAIRDASYPVQIIWGKKDNLLPREKYVKEYLSAKPDAKIFLVEGKHFVQEEFPEIIIDRILELAKTRE